MKRAGKIILMFMLVLLMAASYINCKAEEITVAVDEAHFPDQIFRKYITENIDKNKNGVLSQNEIHKVKKIKLWRESKYYINPYDKIDLQGINYFFNLKQLNIYAQKYINLSLLSQQKLLESVCFYSDEQKVWNIPEIKNLKKIIIDDEDIKKIDLSKNMQLEEIKLIHHANTRLKLDLKKNIQLKKINIISKSKKKSKLDFSHNKNLKKVNLKILCSKIIWPQKNHIEDLTFTNPSKKNVKIDLSKNIRLKKLHVNNNFKNKIKLNLSVNKNLVEVWLNTPYSKIVWPKRNNIKKLNIKVRQPNQKMEIKELKRLKNLEVKFVKKDKVKKLNISKCPELKTITVEGKGKLNIINLNEMKRLQNVYIDFGKSLRQIQFTNTPNVKDLGMAGKNITKTNLNSLKKLEYIHVDYCGLKKVDLRNLKQLKELVWNYSKCETMLFKNNKKLEQVEISYNRIKGTLNLSDMSSLWSFYCDHNKITEIYASKKLKEFNFLFCEYNKLKKINLYHTYVEHIYAEHNPTLKAAYLNAWEGVLYYFDKGVKKHYKGKW